MTGYEGSLTPDEEVRGESTTTCSATEHTSTINSLTFSVGHLGLGSAFTSQVKMMPIQ